MWLTKTTEMVISFFFFRQLKSPTCCILCGKEKLRQRTGEDKYGPEEYCMCKTSTGCIACEKDILARSLKGEQNTVVYSCEDHGAYRRYEDSLIRYKVHQFNICHI